MLAGAVIDRNVDSHVAGLAVASRGELRVMQSGGRSVVSRAYAESPLKLLMPRNHGSAAWIYTSTYGGGLVDRDHLVLHVDVGAGAAAMCSTQASTKVYRSAHGTRADLLARVGEGALLVSLPDPLVCFEGARYAQRQSFELAAGASLVHVDWLAAGRRGRGERWVFNDYRSTLEIRSEGRLVCHDRLTLGDGDGAIAERLGRFDVLATVALVGPGCVDQVQALVAADAARPVERRADTLQAVSPIGAGGGALLRLADTSLERAAATLRSWLSFVPASLGDDPWARKW